MPIPGTLNDGFQRGMLGFPTKNFTCAARVCNQHRWVSRAPRPLAEWYGARRYAAHGFDDLAHGVPLASTQVERAALPPIGEISQRPHVSVGQIRDMNVVADGGAVRGWVIR